MAPARFSPRPGLRKLDRGIRKTSPTFGRPAFLTHAEKAGGGLAVEGSSERIASQLLGLDPNVRAYWPQPFTVDLTGGTLLHTIEEKARARKRDRVRGDRSSFYTPDFALKQSLGATLAVEVKTLGWEGDEAYQNKLSRARDVLRLHSIDLVRLTIPSSWRHPLLTNIPLLHQATKRSDLRPDTALMERIELLSDNGASTLGEFCSGLGFDTRIAAYLIVYGALNVDLMAHHLKNDSPAVLAHGDLSHLSVMEALCQ